MNFDFTSFIAGMLVSYIAVRCLFSLNLDAKQENNTNEIDRMLAKIEERFKDPRYASRINNLMKCYGGMYSIKEIRNFQTSFEECLSDVTSDDETFEKQLLIHEEIIKVSKEHYKTGK